MSFSNQDYLYNSFPARYRREDKDRLLYRFCQHFGEKLDSYDEAFDAFHESITPGSASAEYIAFWLDVLFGWSWFPHWFTLGDKRRVYGNMARHLARRGTRKGIELFLRDFGIVAKVHTKSQPWGEFVYGETSYALTQPLNIIIEILFCTGQRIDACYVGEAVWGESFYSKPARPFTDREIIDLVRFEQPVAQNIYVLWSNGRRDNVIREEAFYEQVQW